MSISTAYERTSVIITTNLPCDQWAEVLGSARLTGAVLDQRGDVRIDNLMFLNSNNTRPSKSSIQSSVLLF